MRGVLETRECVVCGRSITQCRSYFTNRPESTTCSEECRLELRESRKAPRSTRYCVVCGTAVTRAESQWQVPVERQKCSTKCINTTHGKLYHPSYSRWHNIMTRCHYNPTKNYGLRGVSMYPEWHDVTKFLDWLDENLGPCPEGYSLDRIDNNGNYEPGNLRWATYSQQIANRRASC